MTLDRPRPGTPLVVPALGTPRRLLTGLLIGAVAARLAWTAAPASSDEGGFLLLARQWQPGGTSLYGNYWVDRPPLLIAFFRLADVLGGLTALRLLGCVLAVGTVVLAYRLGGAIQPGRQVAGSVAVAGAAFVTSPLFGANEIDGELVAVPLVLAGLLCVVRASGSGSGPARAGSWLLAGALGAAAALVKQNFIDVFVFAAAFVTAAAFRGGARAGQRRGLVLGGATLLAGAAAMTVVVLAVAWRWGTPPTGLWDALVTFRAEASGVIGQSSSSATTARLLRYPGVLLLTGAVVPPVVLAARMVRGGREPIVVATAVTLTWELFAVLAGGSYWLHYLVGLIPGLVLAVAVGRGTPGGWDLVLRAGVWYALAVTTVAVVVTMPATLSTTRREIVGEWLGASARTTDTAVVVYGQPSVLETARLQSPYPELWSLPVRVWDPRLAALTDVLDGPTAPQWVLVDAALDTWGVDPAAARTALRARYHRVADVCDFHVYLRDGVPRLPLPEPTRCPAR